jgi:ATP-binding cassette, subfamily C, bacterial
MSIESTLPVRTLIFELLAELWQFGRARFSLVAGLTLLGNGLRGVGLVLLLPAVSLLNNAGSSDDWISRWFQEFGVTLTFDVVLWLLAVFIILATVLDYWITLYVQRYVGEFRQHLRVQLFERVATLDWARFMATHKSEFIRLLDAEVSQVAFSAQLIFQALTLGVQMLVFAGAAWGIHPLVPWLMSVAVVVIFLLLTPVRRKALAIGFRINKKRRGIFQFVQDGLSILKYVRTLGLERQLMRQFRDNAQAEMEDQYTRQRHQAQVNMAIKLVSTLSLAGAIWAVARFMRLSVEAMLVLGVIIVRFVGLITMMQRISQQIVQSVPAYAAVRRFYQPEQPLNTVSNAPYQAISLTQHIRLDNICLAYGKTRVLDGVSIDIPAHQISVIVGCSGAGKSTLVDVISGLLSPNSGKVWVDDVELDETLRASWCRHVSMVPQDAVLFSGTVRDNFCFSHHPLSDERIQQALTDASMGARFDSLDAEIGPSGQYLSGGERQRLNLARGLAHRHDVLILDEPTSSQDYMNEANIRTMLHQHKQQATIIIIAHKPDMIALADWVIHLKSGTVLYQGTPEGWKP